MQNDSNNFARYPSLKGRVVVVTGGATGIGQSIVAHFARQGSRVAFLDIQDEPARALAAALAAEGCPTPQYIHCDLTDLAALKSAVEQVLSTHNTIDVLVNNAANDQRHSIEEVTLEYWDREAKATRTEEIYNGAFLTWAKMSSALACADLTAAAGASLAARIKMWLARRSSFCL